MKKRKRESMEELQVVEFVVEFAATYLKKKGFDEAENALQTQIQRSNSSNNNAVYVLNDLVISKFFRYFRYLK